MSLDFECSRFSGQMLAAMPYVDDDVFAGSLVMICAHSPEGAMGLIVNRVASGTKLTEASGYMPDVVHALAQKMPILIGGPAQQARPFILHGPDWSDGDKTLTIDGDHALTATTAALLAAAEGRGPARMLVALGYAGWGPGQLEEELRANVWMTMPADPDITFAQDVDAKWTRAMGSIGVGAASLSGRSGTA